ncbi:MAG: hypothetical protein JWO06_3572 [Bacteroidota bacterium]|nr:hypothetical protein [Bacteroidota bacterium]
MNIADSSLCKLFNSLTDEELKELDKAVNSPFFNYREEEKRLFEYLRKAKKSNAGMLKAEVVFEYVYQGEKTDMPKLRHVMTYLTRIISRYIAIHEMEQTEEQKRLLLLRSLRKRNLGKLFITQYESTKQYFDNEMLLCPGLYYQQLQLHTEYYNYSITDKRLPNENLQGFTDQLDSFYVIQKLKQVCNLLSYKNIFKSEPQPGLMNDTLSMITQKNMLVNPLIAVLYFNYMCLIEPDNELNFEKLKNALLNASDRIDIAELRDIFTLAINYCIKRLNTGGQKYYHHVFEIYQGGLQRLVFEENGKLSPFTYKNISAIAIGLKKYEWAFSFIETYKGRLDQEVREGFYAYCLARFYFAKGDYNRVTDLLREVEIKEQFTELDARVLLIKTYYELDEKSLLDYSVENLKQQLKRKRLQTYHEAVYKNFAKMISRLTHLRPYDKKAKLDFKQKLNGINAIAEKEWLLSGIK